MSSRNWFHRALPLVLVVSVLMPSIAAGQGIDAPRIPLRTALKDIATLRTAYVDAFNAHDAAAVSAMYTNDAVAIGADGSVATGLDAIKKSMSEGAENWPHAVIKSDTVKVYGATAVDVGTWTQHPKEGGEEVSHYLAVLRHDMNGWKLAYVASVPVGPKMKM